MYITPEWVQAGAAIATLGAAIVATVIAANTPKRAAAFAEQYRREGKAADDRAQLRIGVFAALMRCRNQIVHVDAVTALNLVDVAFIDAPQVREAWKHFLVATTAEPFVAVSVVERYHGIIHAIAREMELSDRISLTDIQSAYYSRAFGTLDEAALAEAEEKISRRKLAEAMRSNEPR